MKYHNKLQDNGVIYKNKESFLIGCSLRLASAFLSTIDLVKRNIIAGSYFIKNISLVSTFCNASNKSNKRMGPVDPSLNAFAIKIHHGDFHGMKNITNLKNGLTGHPQTRTRKAGQFRKPVVSLVLAIGFWLFTTTSFAAQICNPAVVNIPEFFGGTPVTASTTLTYSVGDASSVIYDVDVDVDITHTYVGDLIADVVSPALPLLPVELFNRPGSPPGFGCSNNDILVTFDDGAAPPDNNNIENECNNPRLTTGGIFQPQDIVTNALSFLNTQQPTGTWTLNVSDNANQDTGTIDNFCVTVTHAAVVFDKWVSNNNTCTPQLDVLNTALGSNVYYCYTVDNVGTEDFEIKVNAATDDKLGRLTGLEGIYTPAGTAGATVTTVLGPYVAGGSQVPFGTTVNNADITVTGIGVNFLPSQTLTTSETATVNVNASSPATGNKQLYLYDDSSLSRIVPGAQNRVDINKGVTTSWTLTPALASALTIDGTGSQIPVTLVLGGGGVPPRNFTISLSNSVIGTFATLNVAGEILNPTITKTYNLIQTNSDKILPAGSTIILNINNTSTGNGARRIRVYPNGSFVNLPSKTVINVDSVLFYDAPYSGGSVITQVTGGSTVYVRAVVSDPFGSFDINAANIELIDSGGITVISTAMSEVNDSLALTKTYEFSYDVPDTGPVGTWTARVTAEEGTEGAVTHILANTFLVVLPDLVVTKTVVTEFDPINNTASPKSIPGAWKLYSITTTNQGLGVVDNNSILITDPIPANTELFVGDLSGGGSPIVFIDGTPSSNLTFDFITDVEFYNGTSWAYTPQPDANGYDANVTNIRINPQGTFAASDGTVNPSFEIRFRVRVQ